MATKEQMDWLEQRRREMKEWAKGRPPIIQELSELLPFLTIIQFGCPRHGSQGRAYVIGYCENGTVILSPVNPCMDYEASMSARFYVDATTLLHGIADAARPSHGDGSDA